MGGRRPSGRAAAAARRRAAPTSGPLPAGGGAGGDAFLPAVLARFAARGGSSANSAASAPTWVGRGGARHGGSVSAPTRCAGAALQPTRLWRHQMPHHALPGPAGSCEQHRTRCAHLCHVSAKHVAQGRHGGGHAADGALLHLLVLVLQGGQSKRGGAGRRGSGECRAAGAWAGMGRQWQHAPASCLQPCTPPPAAQPGEPGTSSAAPAQPGAP